MPNLYSIEELMNQTRRLAKEYRLAMGRPLAVSNELAVYDAARLLNLEIVDDNEAGYDAVGREGERAGKHYQIKARAIFDESKSGQRIGQLKMEQRWDSVLLIIMDDNYEPREIYEASREVLKDAVEESKDSKRAKRGAMSVAKFKIIGELLWSAEKAASE